MLAWEDFLLQNLGAPALFDASHLENLGRIDIGVAAPAHDGNTANHAFVYLRDATVSVAPESRDERRTCTEEYTALYILTGGDCPEFRCAACMGEQR